MGAVPCELVESTAADRAAADVQRWGRGNWIQEKLMACAIGFSWIGVWRVREGAKKGIYPPPFAERMIHLLLREEARRDKRNRYECQLGGLILSQPIGKAVYSISG